MIHEFRGVKDAAVLVSSDGRTQSGVACLAGGLLLVGQRRRYRGLRGARGLTALGIGQRGRRAWAMYAAGIDRGDMRTRGREFRIEGSRIDTGPRRGFTGGHTAGTSITDPQNRDCGAKYLLVAGPGAPLFSAANMDR